MNDLLLHLSAWDVRWLALAKLTLILVGACCLGLLIRPFHPKWRVLVWRGAWLGIVVVLLMGFAPSTWIVTIAANVPKTTAVTLSESTAMVPAELKPLAVETPTTGASASPVVGVSTTSKSPWKWPKPASVLMILWGIGTVGLFVRWGGQYYSLSSMRRGASRAPESVSTLAARIANSMGYRQTPLVLVSPSVSSPCSVSVRQPIIVLPNANDPDIDAILSHEIAHLQSRDLLWFWMMDWLTATLWIHPLCWFMRREHRFACEAASDAAAADATAGHEAYAATLARLALAVCDRQTSSNAAARMVNSSEIVRRVRLLEKRFGAWKTSIVREGSLGVLMLASALLIGGLEFSVADDEDEGLPDSPAVQEVEVDPNTMQIVVAEHVMLIDGRKIVDWEELETLLRKAHEAGAMEPMVYPTLGEPWARAMNFAIKDAFGSCIDNAASAAWNPNP